MQIWGDFFEIIKLFNNLCLFICEKDFSLTFPRHSRDISASYPYL